MDLILPEILKAVSKDPGNPLVYSSIEETKSSVFYDNLFGKGTSHTAELPDLYHQEKAKAIKKYPDDKIMASLVSFLEAKLKKDAIIIEIGGGAQQWRSGNIYEKFQNYFPLDISRPNIELYAKKYNRLGFVADAMKLPFKDNSIDCIFTHDFLEHPTNPEKVLYEIVRVLKEGGIIIHNDAWFCRWWQHYGIVNLKSIKKMTFREKLILLAARITELPPIRISPIILRRLFRVLFESTAKPIKLHYKKLKPNYNLYLGCDEDAASALDPIDTIRFYESRGFKTAAKLSFTQRLFHGHKYITLEKQKGFNNILGSAK